MSTRAEQLTQAKLAEKRVVFSDFLISFATHPITGTLGVITNAESVKQSIRNLILTNYGERFYQPSIGGNVRASLFEFDDIAMQDDLKYDITKTIQDNEPRANLLSVQIISDPDQNKVSISIFFSLVNSTKTESLSVILKRIR